MIAGERRGPAARRGAASSGSSRPPTFARRCCARRTAPDGSRRLRRAGHGRRGRRLPADDAAPRRKLERGDGLTLELEPTPDLLAEIARIARGLDSDGAPTREPLDPVPSSSASPPRPARSSGRPTSCAARASTSSSRTTSPRPASGFGTDTNRVSILAADGSREDLPLQSQARRRRRLLDRVARALDERDAAAQTGRDDQTTAHGSQHERHRPRPSAA